MTLLQSMQSIQLPTELGFRSIRDIRTVLMEAFDSAGGVLLDIPADAEIDLSFLQLVHSARAHAEKSGKLVALRAPLSADQQTTMMRAGISPSRSTEDALFWLHERS